LGTGLKVVAVGVDAGIDQFDARRSLAMSEPPTTPTSSFEQHDDQGLRVADASRAPAREMEVCIACGSRLVHPVSWEETPDGFEVLLRCPECLTHAQDEFSDAELARYDAVLDDGARVLIADLKMLAHANMQNYVRRFISALRAGHIQPEDF
jgi:hypothetical protein